MPFCSMAEFTPCLLAKHVGREFDLYAWTKVKDPGVAKFAMSRPIRHESPYSLALRLKAPIPSPPDLTDMGVYLRARHVKHVGTDPPLPKRKTDAPVRILDRQLLLHRLQHNLFQLDCQHSAGCVVVYLLITIWSFM